MMDINGRLYARYSNTKPGDKLIADGGFTCIDCDSVVVVFEDEDGCLCVPCRDGGHALIGQIEGDHLVGLYPT